MAKTDVVYEPFVTYEIMNNRKPVPVSRPADFVTLTPVVIPMPIMPYMVQPPKKQQAAPNTTVQNNTAKNVK